MNEMSQTSEDIIHPPDLLFLVEKKMAFFQDMLQKTIIYTQKNKHLEILGINDVKVCIDSLYEINVRLNTIIKQISVMSTESIINELQNINNEFSG
jgi:sulfur relay (sulfurtransferase) DsrF/TusC family protein